MREELHSYFGNGIKMRGTLRFKGALRFDGEFDGEVDTDGVFIVGEQGKVKANVKTGSLLNMGTIEGNVTADQRVSIFNNSQLSGNLDTPSFVSEDGAVFQGSCTMPENGRKKQGKKPEALPDFVPTFPEGVGAGVTAPSGPGLSDRLKEKGKPIGIAVAAVVVLVLGGAFIYQSKNSIMDNGFSRSIYRYFSQGDPRRLQQLADVWFREGNYRQASEAYHLLGSAAPDARKFYLNYAVSLEESGRMAEAAPYYYEYLKTHPDEKEIIKKLSRFYASNGDLGGQVKLLEIIVADSPGNQMAAERLYKLYREKGEAGKALNLYQDRLIEDPPSYQDFMETAELKRKLDRQIEAIEDYAKAVELNPEDLESRLALALVYQKTGQEREAAVHFRRVGRIDPDHVEEINNVAFSHLNAGRVEKAVEFFNVALVQDPQNLRAYHGLATSFIKLGEFDRAEYYGKKGLEIDPDYAPTLNRLAWAYAMQEKELERAEALSLRSMQYKAELPDYMDTLSEVYYHMEEYDKAIEWINKAIDLDPGSSWLRSQLRKFQVAKNRQSAD